MKLKDAIEVVRRGRKEVTWYEEKANEFNEALNLVLKTAEAVEEWRGKMANKLPPLDDFDRGYNSAIDDCAAAYVANLPTVEEILKVLESERWKTLPLMINNKPVDPMFHNRKIAQAIHDLIVGKARGR